MPAEATPAAAAPDTVRVRCAGGDRTFRRGGVEVAAVRNLDCTVTAGTRIALTGLGIGHVDVAASADGRSRA